jgi:hypothetical protein
MNIRKVITLSGLVALAAAPFVAHADGPGKATDACIQAFVDQYVPKGHTVHVRKKMVAPSNLDSYMRRYTIALSATLATSGTELASARCVVSSGGNVIVLDSPPLETYASTADFVVKLK